MTAQIGPPHRFYYNAGERKPYALAYFIADLHRGLRIHTADHDICTGDETCRARTPHMAVLARELTHDLLLIEVMNLGGAGAESCFWETPTPIRRLRDGALDAEICTVAGCPCADEISPVSGDLVRANIGRRGRRLPGQPRNQDDAPDSRSTTPSRVSERVGAAAVEGAVEGAARAAVAEDVEEFDSRRALGRERARLKSCCTIL